MRLLAIALLAASTLTACAPAVCEPQPLPEQFKELAPFFPASAVVCGLTNEKTSVLLNFPNRDVMSLTTEAMLKLTAANWSLGSSEAKSGFIRAEKDGRLLGITLCDQKNGGPYLGHVTGIVTIAGKKK